MSAVKVQFKISRFVLTLGALSGVVFFFLVTTWYTPRRFHRHRGPPIDRLPPPTERPALKPCIPTSSVGDWEFQAWRDADNYGLTDAQCKSAFPALFVEIDKSVAARKTNITVEDLDSQKWLHGMVRCLVYNGELLIIHAEKLEAFNSRGHATLQALHRALISSADRHTLPNIEFIMLVEDFSRENVPRWTYSKRISSSSSTTAAGGPLSDPPTSSDSNIWLMPDFGYWSWPETRVSSYSHFRSRVSAVDDGLLEDGTSIGPISFQSKAKKLIWRGALRPNPLRQKLYDLAKGKAWADVKYINWDDKKDKRRKVMPMEEYCRYAFLAHVEGRSYSGRMKYLLHCRSVLVSHQLSWAEAHHGALVSSGPEQNYVEVRRDWGNLEDEVIHLIEHPELAERIAENSVKTFRDRYLTPAAEACYWRQLIRGWASVGFEPQFYADESKKKWRAVPFESFALTNITYA